MSEKITNCPHEATLDDLRDMMQRVEANVEKIDGMLRGDGVSIGFSGRLAAVEKQVNEQAEDRRVIKQMTVGVVVTAILIAIGGVVYSSLKSGGGR
jgi:hypothetical protein